MARTERQRLVNFNTSTTANMPDTGDFDHGEIAVRYNTDNPELIIKRADNSLVTFKPNSVKIYQNHSGSAFPGQSATCDVTDGNIISYFDGLTVMMKLGYAPDPEYGLSFQINELGYKPVEYSDGTHVGDEWVSGDEIMLVYNGSMEGSTGAWQVVNSKKSSSVVVRMWTNEHSGKDYMYFEAVHANSTVSMMSTLETAPNLEYSTDGVTWQEWQHTTAEGIHTFDTLTLTAVGDRVYLRGDNPNGLGEMPEGAEEPLFSHFDMTGKIVAGGNIMSLLDKTMALTTVPQYGFVGLFAILGEGFDALLTPPAMDTITSIGDHGCEYMYDDCFSITSAADMSALTSIGMYGCAGMYHACSSITSTAAIPSLTSISDHGCEGMYAGCTSLTAAADMPSLTSIGDYGCDSMYRGCTSLTSASDMSSLTSIGGYGCDSMYHGCTSLTAAANMPQLITIGDHGCFNMYSGCTFTMSNDGTTFNFAFPAPPVTAGSTTYNTYYDVAEWMDNTNGF